MTLTWTGRGRLRRIRTPRALTGLARGPAGALTTRFYAFPTDPTEVGLPVVGALVRDAVTGYQSLGMGAHLDPGTALRKALGEAYQLLILLADYDDPDGAFARAAGNPASPLMPWRADRAYARSYRADLRDVVDYGCHLQLHLDPEIQERFEAELAATVDGETDAGELAPQPPGVDVRDAAACLREIVARLAAAGHRVVGVEVTTDDVASAGLHVVRALVPGYYSNSAAGLPFLGGIRLARHLEATPDGRPRLLPLPH
jgi:ribosomal protein S12 methylthiotransferase accessory factor